MRAFFLPRAFLLVATVGTLSASGCVLGDFGTRPSEQELAEVQPSDVPPNDASSDTLDLDTLDLDPDPAAPGSDSSTAADGVPGPGADSSPDTGPTPDAQPDTAQPDIAQSDTAQPDTAQPDTAQPDTAQPDTAQPDTAQPDTAQPDTTEPDTTEPDTTEGPAEWDPDDYDLDGLVGDADPCPTVWSPDGDGAICAAAPPAIWSGLPSRGVLLDPAPSRRVRELVEIPLVTGWLNESVYAYWRLDGDVSDHAGEYLATPTNVTYSEGAFGPPGAAATFDGTAHIQTDLPFDGTPPYTVATWVQATHGTLLATDFGPTSVRVWLADGSLHAKAGALAGAATFSAPGDWHHVALIVTEWLVLVTLDGSPVIVVGDNPSEWGGDTAALRLGASYGDAGDLDDPLTGRLDDVIVYRRPLAVSEIRSYVLARRPWGTDLVPGAEADLDDVVLTAHTPYDLDPYLAPFELVGARPHSDAACPLEADDGTFAHRDDLCGVVERWTLDAITPYEAAGRFGEADAAMDVDWDPELTVPIGFTASGPEQTWEMWLLPEPCPDEGDWTVLSHGATELLSIGTACRFGLPAFGALEVSPEEWGHADQWLHVAIVSSAAEDLTHLYIDGQHMGAVTGSLPPLAGAPVEVHATGATTLDELIEHDVAKSPDYLRRRGGSHMPALRWLASTRAESTPAGQWDWYDYQLRWGADAPSVDPPLYHGPDGQPFAGLQSAAMGLLADWQMTAQRPTAGLDLSTSATDASLADGVAGPAGGVSFTTDGEDDAASLPGWSAGQPRTVELLWRHRGGGLFTLVAEGAFWSLQGTTSTLWLMGGAASGSAPLVPGESLQRAVVDFTPAAAWLDTGAGPIATPFGPSPGGQGALTLAEGTGFELHRLRVTAGRVLHPAEQLPLAPARWALDGIGAN